MFKGIVDREKSGVVLDLPGSDKTSWTKPLKDATINEIP
jgi:hypothetical protein